MPIMRRMAAFASRESHCAAAQPSPLWEAVGKDEARRIEMNGTVADDARNDDAIVSPQMVDDGPVVGGGKMNIDHLYRAELLQDGTRS